MEKTQGFVFKTEDMFEADRIFSVFTKDFGRIEVVGKSIRKIASKLRSGIPLFGLSEIEFIQGKNKKTLTDALTVEKFPEISQSPEKLMVAKTISEFVDRCIKGQEPDEGIFALLNETFGMLDNLSLTTANFSLLYPYFFWNFVSLLGYKPELASCVSCSQKLNPYGLYFSAAEGGVLCKQCSFLKREGIKINSALLKVMRLMLQKEWPILLKVKVEKNWFESLGIITNTYKQYILNRYGG